MALKFGHLPASMSRIKTRQGGIRKLISKRKNGQVETGTSEPEQKFNPRKAIDLR